jgi:hypothetical protein
MRYMWSAIDSGSLTYTSNTHQAHAKADVERKGTGRIVSFLIVSCSQKGGGGE